MGEDIDISAMWPFSKKHKEGVDAHKRLKAILNKLGKSSATFVEFSAKIYFDKIRIEHLKQADVDMLVDDIKREGQFVSKFIKYELTLFAGILLIFLNIVQGITLFGISLPGTQNVLALVISLFSAAQICLVMFRLDYHMKVKVLERVFKSCRHLDESGLRFLLLENRMRVLTYWHDASFSGSVMPGWKYYAVLLYIVVLTLYLFLIMIAVPAVVISASFTLAAANDWQWLYLIIFCGSVLSSVSRFIFWPMLEKMSIDYVALQLRKKFYSDSDRYGFEGALMILEDEINRKKLDIQIAPRDCDCEIKY